MSPKTCQIFKMQLVPIYIVLLGPFAYNIVNADLDIKQYESLGRAVTHVLGTQKFIHKSYDE